MIEPRSPYPWFGGKKRVAHVVWRAFDPNVPNFIDAAFGSNSVLLARPGGAGKIETVNDADRMVCNFWRAITADPVAVAKACDWPVNEADMHAVHRWLVEHLRPGAEFRERMHTDIDYFDVKIAGRWVWGLCCWIGAGWCVEPHNHKHPKLDGIGKGVHSDTGHAKARNVRGRQRPKMSADSGGMGVHSEAGHRKRPRLASEGTGVTAGLKRQLPALAVTTTNGVATGKGVHSSANQAHLPSLGNDRGIHGVSAVPNVEWFLQLQARMRRFRVACGDWTRVLGESVLGKGKNVGGRRPCAVFLDPPYGHDMRNPGLYAEDSSTIAADMREWALEHGDDPDLRICLAGYFAEHAEHMPNSWTVHRWKAARGYAAEDNTNREQETLWFSPHCRPIEQQRDLFEVAHG